MDEKTFGNQTLQQKSNQRDKYIGSSFERYSKILLKWTMEELRQMEQSTRKLMTMHKTFHLRDDIENFLSTVILSHSRGWGSYFFKE